MYKLAYKVVKREENRLLSCKVSDDNSMECREVVEYFVDKWAIAPQDTRLFVFENLQQARSFKRYTNEIVYQCLICDYVRFFPCESIWKIARYWELFNNNVFNMEEFENANVSINTAISSLLAKKVMLLEKVA